MLGDVFPNTIVLVVGVSRKRRPRKRRPRKRRPRKTISINNSQTKKLRKKKREQRTFIRGKGDT